MQTLEQALEYRNLFIGVGLDSTEIGNPPSKFKLVFQMAREHGLHLVAHAGEEASAEYIWQALDILGVERIDHGNSAITDKALIQRLAIDKIPLTMCPLSNLCLKILLNLTEHPAQKLLNAGVIITINSDDPAYFGGYINENYLELANGLNLTAAELSQIAQNSFRARF